MLVEFEGELELGGLSRLLTSPPADNDDSERRQADQSKNQERNLDSPLWAGSSDMYAGRG